MNQMYFESVQEFIRKAPAQVGDVVWAWDDESDKRVVGVLVGIDPDDDTVPGQAYRVSVGRDDCSWWKNVAPYTTPKKRPMTHKECFELVGKWVFMNPHYCVFSSWTTYNRIEDWKGCPISELVEEPLENSPWRALEVEE